VGVSGYRRGSGTSQATAVVSGAAALVIQQHPSISPSQLKNMLLSSAYQLPNTTNEAEGKGELDLAKAYGQNPGSGSSATFVTDPSTGTGTLEGARGSSHLSANGVTLSGEVDIFGAAWSSAAMASREAAGTSWSGGTWNGTAWTGSAWNGSHWSGAQWLGSDWSGSHWSDAIWSGSHWSGSHWSDSTWAGSHWSGSHWSDNVWADATWS
jgi:serine protease AprX